MTKESPSLVALYPFLDTAPTFALPIFKLGNELCVQNIRARDDSVDGFKILQAESSHEGVVDIVERGVDSEKRIIAYIDDSGAHHIGTVEDLRDLLCAIARDERVASQTRVQAAELAKLDVEARAALGVAARAIHNRAGPRAARAFAKSSALSVVWSEVQTARIDDDVRAYILSNLYKSRLYYDGEFEILADFSEIGTKEALGIDWDAIQEEIKNQVSLPIKAASSDNDNIAPKILDGEIKYDNIKNLLDKTLGDDLRISRYRYMELAQLLGVMGFRRVEELEPILKKYSSGFLSNIATGARQGQVSRFEIVLIAALGGEFLNRYPYHGRDWLKNYHNNMLSRMRESGVETGVFTPPHSYDPEYGTRMAAEVLSQLPLFKDEDRSLD